MDIWQLNIFCKVIESGSFSKAGRIVHLSQPTVSNHIKDLESYFGCRLIDRLSREAVPTKAGDLLYDYARRILTLKDETESAMSEFMGKIQGTLKLGASTIPGTYILPPMIARFVKKYPDVSISLQIGDSSEIISDIASGFLEFGIVGAKSNDKSLSQKKLLEDELCLMVAADHPWAGRESIVAEVLFEEAFIMREAGSGTRESFENSLRVKGYDVDSLNIAAEMGSTTSVIQGIRHGLGVSVLSRLAAEQEAAGKDICALSIEGISLKRHFYITSLKQKSASPLASAFIEELV